MIKGGTRSQVVLKLKNYWPQVSVGRFWICLEQTGIYLLKLYILAEY